MISLEEYRALPLDKNVNNAVDGAMYGPVSVTLYRAVNGNGSIYWAVYGDMSGDVYKAVDRAVYWSVFDAVRVAVDGAVNSGFQGD